MIEITANAMKHIRLAIEDEDRADLALRIAISGRGPAGFRYKMDLVGPEEKEDNDQVFSVDGLDVYVDPDSQPNLEGATVDFVQGLQESGFKFDNPNSAWGDPSAAEVQKVIEQKINPQIASHGGFVTLLDVREDTAFISMGGGCQGCGMADVTLRHGVTTAILEAVPAIKHVLDTTDHAAGANPFYAG